VTAFLVLVLSISACRKDEQNLGIGILPDEDGLVIGRDTIFPVTSIFKADSIKTSNLAEAFIGAYTDPVFGQTNVVFNFELELPGNNLDLGDPNFIIVDSVVLGIKTTSRLMGSLQPMEFVLEELSEPLYEDSIYFSNEQAAVFSENLVDAPGSLTPITNASVLMRGDSVFDELRIKVSNSLGERIVNAPTNTPDVFDNDEIFQEFLYGLSLRTNTANGASIGIDPNSILSALNIYYRNTEDPLDPDTTFVSFQIDDNSAYFNQISRDYSISQFGDFTGELLNPQYAYLQGINGIMSKLNISDIYTEELGDPNLALSQAELILPLADGMNDNYSLPPILFISTGNRTDSLKIVEDDLTSFRAGGFYDSSLDAYVFSLPFHAQNIYSEFIQDESLWISVNPPATLRDLYSAGIATFTDRLIDQRRVVLNTSSSSQDVSKNMRLVLTYSE